jgi:alpha-N-arabinofuranosidase
VPENQIQAYVQDAINEIQFITGDANTNSWAKLRAKYGRTQPYKLKYIEIGNEDFFVSSIINPFVSLSERWLPAQGTDS